MGKIRRLLTLIIILGTPILCVNVAYGASYVAQYVGAAISDKWVRVSTGGPVAIDIVPTATGTLGVNKGTISVETNSDTGYRLYISGVNSEPNGYTALYHGGNPGASAKLNSVTSSSPLSSGYWGYAMPSDASKYAELANIGATVDSSVINSLSFSGVQQNYTFLKSSSSANEGNPDNLDIYYGAMADNSIPNGSYYNVVVYTAFVEGGDNIVMTPSTVKNGEKVTFSTGIQGQANPISADQIEVSLYDSAHPGQNVGTCDNLQVISDGTASNPLSFSCDYQTGTHTSDNNVQYDANVKVDVNGNGIYLSYDADDIWNYQSGLQTISSMQDMTAELCANTPTYEVSGNTYTLEDTRGESKSYLIRKLADNRCWMIQNLALEGEVTLYGADQGDNWDSNIPSGTYTTPDGSMGSDKSAGTEVQHMYNGTHKDAQNDNTSDNTGAYYSWNVATAGYDTAGSLSSGNSNKSICPKGWRLPTSSDSGEFKTLYASYDSSKGDMDAAFNLSAYVGYYNSGSLKYPGSDAYWWSSTTYATTLSYDFYETYSGYIYPSSRDNRFNGFSVRCVAQ